MISTQNIPFESTSGPMITKESWIFRNVESNRMAIVDYWFDGNDKHGSLKFDLTSFGVSNLYIFLKGLANKIPVVFTTIYLSIENWCNKRTLFERKIRWIAVKLDHIACSIAFHRVYLFSCIFIYFLDKRPLVSMIIGSFAHIGLCSNLIKLVAFVCRHCCPAFTNRKKDSIFASIYIAEETPVAYWRFVTRKGRKGNHFFWPYSQGLNLFKYTRWLWNFRSGKFDCWPGNGNDED